tara:strand:+ start:61 stop:375 length:315 start_codon:yes stop_codon:yes gene_type:complete
MSDLVVQKIVEKSFNSAQDLITIYLEENSKALVKVLGVKYGNRVAMIEAKNKVKGVHGWKIVFGIQGKPNSQLLESKSTSPNNFTQSHYSNYNTNLVTQAEYYK